MKSNTTTSLAIKGLSGAVTLAGATQAYGAIVAADPPAMTTITGNSASSYGRTTWDVNGDGTDDFILGARVFTQAGYGLSKDLSFTGFSGYGSGNYLVGYTGTAPVFGTVTLGTDLSTGTTIGPSSAFAGVYGYFSLLGVKYGSSKYGQFAGTGGTTGYIGFEFTEADGTHYGYGKFTSVLTGTTDNTVTATLIYDGGYYQTTPNTPIAIPAAVPEPTSLAALAFGAAGVAGAAAYRRKQAA